MLYFAYSRKLPVQVVMTANKEAVISEKDMSAHFGQTLLVGYSKTIHATVTFEVFDLSHYSLSNTDCSQTQSSTTNSMRANWLHLRDDPHADWLTAEHEHTVITYLLDGKAGLLGCGVIF